MQQDSRSRSKSCYLKWECFPSMTAYVSYYECFPRSFQFIWIQYFLCNHGSRAIFPRSEPIVRSVQQCNKCCDLDWDLYGITSSIVHVLCILIFNIILRNVRSILSDQRILLLHVNLHAICFHICSITETWTCHDAEQFMIFK